MSQAGKFTDKNGKYIFYNQLKILLIGDQNTGKTQLMYTKCSDSQPIQPTIGVDYSLYQHQHPKANLIIWDTAGDERFRGITSAYYRGAVAFIIVFDLTNTTSFMNVKDVWYPMIKECGSGFSQVVVVGTKCDLSLERTVSRERAQILADDLQLQYFEASGTTGHNVEFIFTTLIKAVIDMIETEAENTNNMKPP